MKTRFYAGILMVFALAVNTKAVDIDVKLSIPNNISAVAGQSLTIPINLSNIASSFSLDSFQLIVSYDGTFFENPLASGFQLGSLTTGTSYSGLDNVDTTSKYFTILRSNVSNPVTLTSSSGGSVVTFNIQVKSSATPGSSGFLNILASQGASNTEIITLSGGPDNIKFNPALGTPSINGLVSIAPVPEPSTYAMGLLATTCIAAVARYRKSPR